MSGSADSSMVVRGAVSVTGAVNSLSTQISNFGTFTFDAQSVSLVSASFVQSGMDATLIIGILYSKIIEESRKVEKLIKLTGFFDAK